MTDKKEKSEGKKETGESQRTCFEFPFNNVEGVPKMMAGCCGSEEISTTCCEQIREMCCPESKDKNNEK